MMLFCNKVAADGIEKAVEAMQKVHAGWECHNCGSSEDTEFGALLWDQDGYPRCPDCASSEIIIHPK